MKVLVIEPTILKGEISIPPSKSLSHRAIICAGLADGVSKIENVVLSEDIAATLEGMEAMGAVVKEVQFMGKDKDKENIIGKPLTISIQGSYPPKMLKDTIDCRESGSTLRFLLPLATCGGKKVIFLGRGKLGERPLDIYLQLFAEQGVRYETGNKGFLPLTVHGSIKPGTFRLQGNVSSQFISGLLFLLPCLEGDSKVILTTALESRGYVDLTLAVLREFGIQVENREYREFLIKGLQKYQPCHYRVEGDYSQAAFWIVAGILGKRIDCLALQPDSLQGDKAILDIARQMGARLNWQDGKLSVLAGPTQGTVINAEHCPDLVPILAVLGALSQGTTRIVNAGRLRMKESDRLKAIATELNKIGGQVQETNDGLLIEGVKNLQGGTVNSWNDHRIAMALAIAAVKCLKPLKITGYEAVRKSYPHFWQDYEKLGGKCYERSLG